MMRSLVGPAGAAARIVVAVTIAAGLLPGAARAEDDAVREAVAGQPQDEQEGNLADLGANFDSNVFEQTEGWVIRPNNLARGPLGGVAGAGGEADSPAVARVRAVGAARLARVERACDLNASQQRKLELAIESDIRRCIAEIEETRRLYAGTRVNMRSPEGQQQWNRFQQDVQRCRRRLMTLFDEGSLFSESLSTVLDEGQLSILTAESAARRSFRWKSLVAKAMLRLDDTLALTQEQHTEVERLLLEKEPALRVDGWLRQRNEQGEQMLVFMVLAEVDQKALRAAVGEDRWKTVVMFANQGRSMRSWIQGQGLLEQKRK